MSARRRPRGEDWLAPWRGLVLGLGIGVVAWVGISVVAYILWRITS